MIIATIRLGSRVAELSDEATWSCPADPELERSLGVHARLADRSPARGDWLRYHATRMAALLGGALELADAGDDADPRDRRRY